MTPDLTRSMESITACALARVRAISTESVSGGIIAPSGSLTADVRRVIPHDATAKAKATKRMLPNRFTPQRYEKTPGNCK